MTATTAAARGFESCGCTWTQRATSDGRTPIRWTAPCHLHLVRSQAFFALHYFGENDEHAECCDLPSVKSAVGRYGRDDVAAAAELIADEGERAYALRLVAMVPKGETP